MWSIALKHSRPAATVGRGTDTRTMTFGQPTFGSAGPTAEHPSDRVLKLILISFCLSFVAFFCSMIGSFGFTSFQFTPAAFGLTLLHHTPVVMVSHGKRMRDLARPHSLPAITGRGEMVPFPLSASMFMIIVMTFATALWLVALAWLVVFLVAVQSDHRKLSAQEAATVIEFAFIVLEVTVMCLLSVCCVRERKVASKFADRAGTMWFRLGPIANGDTKSTGSEGRPKLASVIFLD